MLTMRWAPLPALAVLAVVAGGTSTAPVGHSGTQPAVLSTGQVEAQTQGHPTVLLFTAQGPADAGTYAQQLSELR